MAAVNVSTWSEFVTAFQTGTASGPINLVADIDMNSAVPLGISSSVGGSYGKTVNGNGHQIRNLRTNVSSPVPIFQGGSSTNSYYYFYDVDFVNLCLDAALFDVRGNNFVNFNRCRFTGRRDANLVKVPDYAANRASFTQCFFNFTHSSNHGDAYSEMYTVNNKTDNGGRCVQFTLCKFKLNCSPRATISTTVFSSCAFSGCYFYGTVYTNTGSTYGLTSPTTVYTFGPLTSLFNPTTYTWLGANQGQFGFSASSSGGANKLYVNNTKCDNYVALTNVSTVLCTDAEMKSAQALLDKGLDIVVPIE